MSEIEESVKIGRSIIVHQLLGFVTIAFIGLLFDVLGELFMVILLYILLEHTQEVFMQDSQ